MNSLTRHVFAASLLATAAHAATAALIDRGGGMVYDSDQNITWLQDFGAGGLQYWQSAADWADNLAHGGYTDWRLPATLQPDPGCSDDAGPGGGAPVQSAGYGCTGSEMGYLFYNHLGGNAGESVLDPTGDSAQELANLALFENIQAYRYYSGTSYAPSPAALAWSFGFGHGLQSVDFKVPDGLGSYAVAVRDGDVASTVPEPTGLALTLTALGLLLVAGARRPMAAKTAAGA
ncbi:hypothetical protein [Aquabacterium sp.]|uniref:hypothetical protein n=1 Tax=Aquabacterium sp. TaxID=1872578 RepID=UPI002BD72DCF|nr:hypothetical protein [Aquabacterium sp.]HSW03692.1 hypothetical protein [Aquabacterium sp.]